MSGLLNSRFLGESRSAAKRRAKRYGRCFCCGRLDCNNNSRTTISQDQVKLAIRTPATRFLTENGGQYVNAAIQLALDEAEYRLGVTEYAQLFKYNKAPMGMRSPEETPEFYTFSEPDFDAG
ncbi:nucleic acid binding protein [Grapevine virus I]|uniref:Nucleic acid binding protein n=1 Tax=Grapevine virus I TaxID=2052157 RepID=A0A2K8JK75_9VIRU|nr:nucleic acid binding protein [Grapevine virus I]ATS17354.1 nucleic acid binding protein [Grapevine virus I]